MKRTLPAAIAVGFAAYSLGNVASVPAPDRPRFNADTRTPTRIGPQPDITCPPGAVDIAPEEDIQVAVNANPGATAFCLQAGVWDITSAITAKTGDSFTGVHGATLDASGWETAEEEQGVFAAHNQDIDDVIVQNLIISNCPQRGIHAFRDFSDRWVIDHNEIFGCRMGIHHGNFFRIHHNYIHHNWQYGIGGFRSTGSVIENNEFAFNAARYEEYPGDSATSKWALTTDTIVRGNYFHDNEWSAVWFDGQNSDTLIENNAVVNNSGNGVFYEVSGRGIIRNNIIAGSGARNIYLSEAQDTEVYGNILAGSPRGISLFQDGGRIEEANLGNNLVHDNRVRVPPGGLAVTLTCSNMDGATCSNYSTSRGNRFQGNHYRVPDVTARWWYWNQAFRTWGGWQAQGQDNTGTVEQG